MDRLQDGDPVLRDFLDIFNHRLISLLYRVRKTLRPGFAYTTPEGDAGSRFLLSLVGLGTPGLRRRLGVPDRALTRFAGLLAHYPRSAAGLRAMLEAYFDVAVEIRQLLGRYLYLAVEEQSAIGLTGRNQRLGRDLLLGRYVFDVPGRLEIRLGPLTLEPFLDLLPIGAGFRELRDLVRLYLGDSARVDVQLTLAGPEVPVARLGARGGADAPRLGWTTWLKTRPGAPPRPTSPSGGKHDRNAGGPLHAAGRLPLHRYPPGARHAPAAHPARRGAPLRTVPLPARDGRPERQSQLRGPRGPERDGLLRPRRGADALPQRDHQALLPGRHGRALHHLPRRAGALAVAPGADHRLAHLPGEDGARDRGADLQRSSAHRLPPGADQDVRRPRVLRAVPGDGAELRHPPAGGRGDLVLLPARGRQAHPCPGGRRLRPPGVPRTSRGGALPVRRARRDEHGRRRLLHLRAAGGSGQVRGGRLQLRDAVQRPGAGAGGGGGRRQRQPLRVPRRLHPDRGGRAPGRDAPGEPPLGPHAPTRGGTQPGLQRRTQLPAHRPRARAPPIRSGCCTG